MASRRIFQMTSSSTRSRGGAGRVCSSSCASGSGQEAGHDGHGSERRRQRRAMRIRGIYTADLPDALDLRLTRARAARPARQTLNDRSTIPAMARARSVRLHLALTVNGEPAEAAVDPAKTLLEVLREDLQLTGTKHGCELGECGACAVLLDGEPVLSCLVLALECAGREVLTVEGLARDGRLDPLQETFADLGAVAVRLLHAGHPGDRAGAARSRAATRRASRSARRCRATCAAAPATCRSSRRSRPPPRGRRRTRAAASARLRPVEAGERREHPEQPRRA